MRTKLPTLDQPRRKPAVESIAREALKVGEFDSALTWAEQLKDPEARRKLTDQIITAKETKLKEVGK